MSTNTSLWNYHLETSKSQCVVFHIMPLWCALKLSKWDNLLYISLSWLLHWPEVLVEKDPYKLSVPNCAHRPCVQQFVHFYLHSFFFLFLFSLYTIMQSTIVTHLIITHHPDCKSKFIFPFSLMYSAPLTKFLIQTHVISLWNHSLSCDLNIDCFVFHSYHEALHSSNFFDVLTSIGRLYHNNECVCPI